jgi:hypothetical protein
MHIAVVDVAGKELPKNTVVVLLTKADQAQVVSRHCGRPGAGAITYAPLMM